MIKVTINRDSFATVSVLCDTKQQASALASALTGLPLVESAWDVNSELYYYTDKRRCSVTLSYPDTILSFEQHEQEQEVRNAKD